MKVRTQNFWCFWSVFGLHGRRRSEQ